MTDFLPINPFNTWVMLLSDGEHIAPLVFFANPIALMSKTTFYFVIIVLVSVAVIESNYQKKIIKLDCQKINGNSNNEHE